MPRSQESRADARTAIENLLFTYAERIDAGDFAGVGALFEKASIYGPDGEVSATGADEARMLYEKSTRLYEDGTPRTQHVTTNLILELAEDGLSASGRSRFTVFQGVEGEALQPIIAGHYHDRFAWSEALGWHFVERRMRPTLLGDLSKHLLFELAER